MTAALTRGELCGAKTRTGGACRREAGWGTDHVGIGACKLHGGCTPNARRAAALRLAVVMGEPVDVDPLDALLTLVQIAAGEVNYASIQVANLSPDQALVDGRYLHPWIRARQDALDRLAKISAAAISAGVAERQVAVAERVGTMLGKLIAGILDDPELGASKAVRARAPAVVAKHLHAVQVA